jgi:FkbH-like protein
MNRSGFHLRVEKMKLVKALNILKGVRRRKGESFTCFLATAMNPLHLGTFLAAELSLLFRDQRIEIQSGLYGDFLGNLDRLARTDADCGIVLMEWTDLDPRLGIRSVAAWSEAVPKDILANIRTRVDRVQQTIEQTCQRMPVVLCLPTLPLPPISCVPGWQASSFELELKSLVESVAARVSQGAQVRVLSPERIDLRSPLRERLDVKSELLYGFPYKLEHASALGNLLARLTPMPAPKKGLITDLDDTLWRGILGEVGIDEVSWDLDHHSQMHAFYQRLLSALAMEGSLIAVASKNEPSLVEKAFGRKDLALSRESIFPMEVNWGAKSESVGRILKAWNIGPESVVFVDDSAIELAEVKAAHPDVECIQFPTKDSVAIYELVLHLRDLFGKAGVLPEDTLRAASIRRSHAAKGEQQAVTAAPTSFLEQIEAEMSFNFCKAPLDPRALELVNKTNQFNLNGKRYTEATWHNYFRDPASFLMVVSYKDRFGPLGRIAVIAGRQTRKLKVDAWVMSCRAFSRRIEYRCLEELFAKFDVEEIELDYSRTDRNSPLTEFLTEILAATPFPSCTVSKRDLAARSEAYRRLQETMNG